MGTKKTTKSLDMTGVKQDVWNIWPLLGPCSIFVPQNFLFKSLLIETGKQKNRFIPAIIVDTKRFNSNHL